MDRSHLYYILKHSPNAIANIKGSFDYPNIEGRAAFYQIHEGVIVYTEITGLPYSENNPFTVHGYHIHEGTECAGNDEDPFSAAEGHFNPTNEPHPYHAGDLPPLFGNYGNACNAVYTSRLMLMI